jgi:hypothetical protein
MADCFVSLLKGEGSMSGVPGVDYYEVEGLL